MAQRGEWLLDIALDHLSLGRAELVAWQADQSGDLAVAEEELNQAVDGLRQAGTIEFVALGLLARAALFRVTGEVDRARRDLDEVRRIAKRSEMRLFECDAHLEAARLHLAQDRFHSAARAELDQAKALIETTGYHRRDRDVEEIEAELARNDAGRVPAKTRRVSVGGGVRERVRALAQNVLLDLAGRGFR